MATRSRWFRLSMFGLLYFVQGSALAYFRNFQKPYLSRFSIEANLLGLLTSLLLLPFVLKIFLGMLSDRVNLFGMGHRKPYMLLGLILAAGAFASVSFVSPGNNFILFSILVVLASFSVTIFDSSADGLAIDITPENEQGRVQSVMVGGRAIGIIILSWVFGTLGQSSGYQVVFLIIAGSMLIPLLLVSQVHEPAERHISQSFDWRAFGEMVKPHFLMFAVYAFVYSIVSFGIDGQMTYFMSQEFNATDTVIGSYGALRGIGALIGAVGAGILIDRLGHRLLAYSAVAMITIGGVIIGLATGNTMLLVLGVVWGIAWGFQETIFVALAMELTDSRIAASMFALMMTVSNIGTDITEGLSTSLTDDIGFQAVFFILAGINITVFPILWGLFKIAPQLTQRPSSDPQITEEGVPA